MKLLRLFSLLLLGGLLSGAASAQCEYRLDLFDSFGDGWAGGSVKVTQGATSYVFTLDDVNDDGLDSTVYFVLQDGQPFTVSWAQGFFNNGFPTVVLYDYDQNELFNIPFPAQGTIFNGVASCPDCLHPTQVKIENVYATYAKIRWQPGGSDPVPGWLVIYGPAGFTPGPGQGDTLTVGTPKATISGLQEKTAYDFYLLQDCGGDSSALYGPFSFETYYANDVGISGVVSPQSSCDLDLEKVVVRLSNFGANPQSLLPFRYSVNGVDAGVPQPEDGFYTGVLGKDSTETIEFETQFDFSGTGEYIIAVWTEMPGDQDLSNDTFYYHIVNRLQAPYFQDFETWNGAWHVDSASLNPSWQFGTPAKTTIIGAASGVNAWVTGLTAPYNSSERSYLDSPCFDFSNLTQNPVIQFSINYNTELSFDGGYLEVSTDGGNSWEKVGALGEGLNWYTFNNTILGLGDVWAGVSNGWVTARHLIPNVAGKADVRLRFAFEEDGAVQYDGIAIDDIRIYVPFQKDLVALTVTTAGEAETCGLENDKITLNLTNYGTQSQAFFQVGYSINGGAPVQEGFTGGILSPDEAGTYTFNAPFDSRDSLLVIKVWVKLPGDEDPSNDTITYTIDHRPTAVPFQENFEEGVLPVGWTSAGVVTSDHNNISNVLAFNLYSFNMLFTHESPRFGPLGDNDSLSFDYRITNFDGDGTIPTVLLGGSKIEVQISTDCGETYATIYTINSINHFPAVALKTLKFSLAAYAGQSIRVRFVGTWGAGDFWVDIDNVNIRACPADMGLSSSVVQPGQGQQNGSITVQVGLGNPPYQYLWSNGGTSATITNLGPGAYTVTVTDAHGCTSELTIDLTVLAAGELAGLTHFSLRPNPTTGLAQLTATFDHAVDARLELFGPLGQSLWQTNLDGATNLSETLDLTAFPDGFYWLRVTADGQSAVKKLVKSR